MIKKQKLIFPIRRRGATGEQGPVGPSIITGAVDVTPDPITVGNGDDFSSLADAYRAIEKRLYMSGVRQDVIINGTSTSGRDEYEVTSEDAISYPMKNGSVVDLRGTRYQTGQSRITIADIPRVFRDTPTGAFYTPTDPITYNAVGRPVITQANIDEMKARVDTGIAWANTQIEARRKTILRCTSNKGLVQALNIAGGLFDLAVVNEFAGTNTTIRNGTSGVERDGRSHLFFDGCWFHGWDVVVNTAAGGGISYGTKNEFTGNDKVIQGQYNWKAVYSDHPSINPDDQTSNPTSEGSGNICAFGGEYVRAKGDGGSIYIPKTFITGSYRYPLDLDGVGYTNTEGMWTRDNAYGTRLTDCFKVAARNCRFGETLFEHTLGLFDVYKFFATDTMAYGGTGDWDVWLEDRSVSSKFITPMSDGSGTATPSATRINYFGYNNLEYNELHYTANVGKGNGATADLYRINTYNPVVTNRPAPPPVVGAWYATAGSDGSDYRKYICRTIVDGWVLLNDPD